MNEHRKTQNSRRNFVKAAALTGLGFAFQPHCLLSAESPMRKLSFAVVTDTHIGRQQKNTAAKQWEKTAAEIAKSSAEIVMHLGDVVDSRQEDQYPIYLETRKTIPQPIHEIPGNHDPAELFEKYLRKPIDTTVDHHWLRFVLLNDSRTDSHDGFLSKKQLGWIKEQCEQAERDKKFLAFCMHVPVHFNRPPDRAWYVKPKEGQTEFYAILEKHYSRVLCLLHGHFHNGIRGWADHGPMHEILFPSATYNQDRKLEEKKAPGYNLPEFRPGYTQITIENQTMTLNYHPVGIAETAQKACPLLQLGKTNS